MFLIFDTETTGFPSGWDVDPRDLKAYDSARLVQLAWQLHDTDGKLIGNKNYIVKPDGFEIPYAVVKIHGITTERALKDGHDIKFVLNEFTKDLEKTTYNVGHNIDFDLGIVGSEYYRAGLETILFDKKRIDTKEEGTEFCAIPGGRGGKFKWPTLTELHQKLFNKPFADAHDAAYDVDATARCFFGLITQRVYKPEEIASADQVKYQAPKLKVANFVSEKEVGEEKTVQLSEDEHDEMVQLPFAHLHCHTQFSVLQSPSSVNDVIGKAKSLGLTHVAMTDHGNMMGAFHFVREALKQDLTPILGIEINVCKDHLNKDTKDNGFQTVILAKNKNGYHNLTKIASISQTEGFYYVPRISREVLLQYKEDLIILTGGPWGEVPSLILNAGEMIAEKAFIWWKENFGDDFYAEINRHGLEEEKVINDALFKFCKKHDVKYIASNNTYYAEQSDAKTQDVLLCVRDGEQVSKPSKYIGKGGREFRFGFPNDQFFMKSKEEMVKLFADIPESIENIQEILDQTERYKLAMDVLLPAFDIPQEFIDPLDAEDGGKRGENAYLRHLTYEGAKKRWGEELNDETIERLDFELETIAKTGYPGYFLIVQDFTTKAREMDVSVGPGRGSAAGSAVAYCVAITNVDPIKYNLLFERFLNPERVSLPDIDIDFDDEGRQRVIDYVIDKYGSNQVAQIITYGSMAAKSSIRDAARVLDLPLSEADRIAKLVPGIKLKKLFAMNEETLQNKFSTSQEDLQKAKMLVDISKQIDLSGETLNQAIAMEGSMRNTGIHACGVIITPEDITNYVPVARAKDSDMSCTQFDNSVVEDAGLLKMDFLGLKTLTLIKDTVRLVKENYGVEIIPDDIPLDDVKTYELFQRGETVGIFQYESGGMQKYLKELKPTEFSDLIAMNALYRPGPIEYIPEFIRRKHGDSEIVYDLDDMKEYLEETYGITVYQEQVMLLSQKLADFTKGEADVLRKAMGKKQIDVLAKMKPKFIEQASAKGHAAKTLEKIWKDWEAFASYAFNKSHSTCYALIAFHTAYLKAHYPSEYMAAVLSNNMNDIKSVTFFMEECRRGGIPVLGPDVNESSSKFSVNKKKEIRCGMAAIKGVGAAAVNSIIDERSKNGEFKNIFDFIERIDLRTTNKKVIENLVYGGGFDSFGIDRANFFAPNEQGVPFIESLIKYGNALKGQDTNQQSLFGEDDAAAAIAEPKFADAIPWRTLERLSKEKEVVGMYISGHPLDDYKIEIDNFCTKGGLEILSHVGDYKHKELKFAGIVSEFAHKFTKNGKPYGIFVLEDYVDSHRFFVFGEEYVKFKDYFVQDWFLYVKGKVQQRRFSQDPDDFEFRINTIELLSDVRDKYVKKLTINVGLKDISKEFVDQLHEKMVDHPGKCKFQIKIVDIDMSIKMPAKNLKIELSNKLIEELESMQVIDFSVS